MTHNGNSMFKGSAQTGACTDQTSLAAARTGKDALTYIGQPTPMEDAVRKVTGQAIYGDDMAFSGMLHGKILYSPHAHARIVSLDVSAARALHGVRAVITYENTPDTLYNRIVRHLHDPLPATERVFDTILRNVSDEVAAVAADTEEIAQQALQLIQVEYEELPAVFDAERALDEDAPKLYPEGNLLKHQLVQCGDANGALAQSEHVFENMVETKPIHHGALEPHVYIARWDRQNDVEIWGTQQGVHRAQVMIAGILGLPFSKVQYHCTTLGGSFGGKDGVMGDIYAALLSKEAGGRPVKIRFTRRECITATYTRHAMRMYTKMGVSRDGTITALDFRGYMNAGPYCSGSINVLSAMCGKMFKVYRIPNMRFDGKAVYTNALLGGAMRGFGSPKVFTAVEVLMDKAAKSIGMDPVELRLKNAMRPYDMDPVTGDSLYNGRLYDCLQKGRELFGWDAKKSAARAESSSRYAYGVGAASAMHGNGVASFAPDITVASVSVQEDGSILVRTGVTDHGAGTYTLMKMIAAETLELPPEEIVLVNSDTLAGEYDNGSGASRNTWTGGEAVARASMKMRDRLTRLAADLMDISPSQVELRGGEYWRKDGRAHKSRREIAWYAQDKKRIKLIETVSHQAPHNAGSYGAHFTRVRVDKKTGEVKVLEYTAVCDVGTALNPLLLQGQIEGAILMGLGMALFEEVKLDDAGRPINANLRKYRLPKASDMPEISVHFVEEYEDGGPYGGKSIGEASIVPVAPAIINAVNDALETELADLPLTPEKILAAIR